MPVRAPLPAPPSPVPGRTGPGRAGGTRVRVLAVLLGLLLAVAGPGVARADGTASRFSADATVDLDGTLRVQQTITFADPPPAEVTQRFELREDVIGDRQYVTTLSDVVAAPGSGVTPTVREEGRFTTVTVPTGGARSVAFGYTVRGAVVTTDTGTALRWRLLQGLSADVDEFVARVRVPVPFDYVRCTAGPPNSVVPCTTAAGGTEEEPVPTFRDGPRGQGEVVGVDIGFPAGAMPANEVVDQRWTLGRAFSADPLPLGLALGTLALGGLALWLLRRRAGRDAGAGGAVTRVGEFVDAGGGRREFRVSGDVRPGLVGTVVDERVDPIDVTASILDLAVRGHLRIIEEARASRFGPTDWTLARRGTGEGLRPFERELLDGVATDGYGVRVSELGERLRGVIGRVQDSLYDEVVSAGWFERRPDATRNRWLQAAFITLAVAVVATVLLVVFTTFGLLGLALVALALALVFVAQETPARTASGTALLAGLGALRAELLSEPTDAMPRGRELTELSEVLPYAVVLGGADRWLDAIVAADTDADADPHDLDWYHGPTDWHLRDLPDSLRNFITTVSGTLFAR